MAAYLGEFKDREGNSQQSRQQAQQSKHATEPGV